MTTRVPSTAIPATGTSTRNDDQQLSALFDRLLSTWTAGDARAYGACFTPDADYVSFDGTRARGVEPMIESHDRLFRGVLAGSALVGEIESIRYLGPDIALVHGFASVLVAWRSRLPERRLTRTTIVAVRTGAGWRITSINNARVRPLGIPAPGSFPGRMARTLVRAAAVLRLGRARCVVGADEAPADRAIDVAVHIEPAGRG
jgi:uncharacterized protein (TIGR02246 family)